MDIFVGYDLSFLFDSFVNDDLHLTLLVGFSEILLGHSFF